MLLCHMKLTCLFQFQILWFNRTKTTFYPWSISNHIIASTNKFLMIMAKVCLDVVEADWFLPLLICLWSWIDVVEAIINFIQNFNFKCILRKYDFKLWIGCQAMTFGKMDERAKHNPGMHLANITRMNLNKIALFHNLKNDPFQPQHNRDLGPWGKEIPLNTLLFWPCKHYKDEFKQICFVSQSDKKTMTLLKKTMTLLNRNQLKAHHGSWTKSIYHITFLTTQCIVCL